MFGFFKWKRCVNDAVQYCSLMFAGLDRFSDGPLPNLVFADAYVAGFLQQIILHAALSHGYDNSDPGKLLAVAEATYNRLVPGTGRQMTKALIEVNNPSHPHHVNYQVGHREGKEYVIALIQNDEATMNQRMWGFRQFVARNYLNRELSN